MKKIVIGSVRENAGKTTIITGLGKALNKPISYMKPFGDRLLYKKKKLWDYDSALISDIFELKQGSQNTPLGFDHCKLRHSCDEAGSKEKLLAMAASVGQDKEILFVEGGRDLHYGRSVNLDVISVAKYLGGQLILVVSGDDDTILDDLTYLKEYARLEEVNLLGIIINKVRDVKDFHDLYSDTLNHIDLAILGILPFIPEFTDFTVDFLVEPLSAKVISGEAALSNVVKNILVGAMSFDALLRSSILQQRENFLLITSGERSDIIVAALDYRCSGIVLTNNTLPPNNIIAKAADHKVPMLMVSSDTYQVAKKIDDMVPLLTKDSIEKIQVVTDLIKNKVALSSILQP